MMRIQALKESAIKAAYPRLFEKDPEAEPGPVDLFPPGVKLAWAMPHTMNMISTATHYSLFMVKRPQAVEYMGVPRGGDIAEKRERQVEAALASGCTHVWLMDGDMVFPPEILVDLFNLLGAGADLAGGLCFRGYPPWEPVLFHPTKNRMMLPFQDFKFGDIVKPRATGAACLLVKRNVFDKLDQPWFLVKRSETDRFAKVEISEDCYFTSHATAAGFKLWVHTKYDVDHIREFSVNRELFFTTQLMARLMEGTYFLRRDRIEKMWHKAADPEWLIKLDELLNTEVSE